MPDITLLIIEIIVGFILLIAFFNGLIYGAAYQRLPTKKLKKIIQLGNPQPNMTVYDLGAGYGRIMFEAAKTGANVVGYEIDPAKVYWITQQIKKKMFTADKVLDVTIRRENLLNADLSQADLVYAYLSPPLMKSLGEKAQKEMRQGTRLISVEHRINELKPAFEDLTDKIYMYQF
jgi:ribosomal protein L11 methylase PrmA